MGLLTCNEDFGADVTALFSVLTGSNKWDDAKVIHPCDSGFNVSQIYDIAANGTLDDNAFN